MTKNSNTGGWHEFEEKIRMAKEMLKSKSDHTREDISAILRRRAEFIATNGEKDTANKEMMSVLEFALGQERYAIETNRLKEIMPASQITDLPCTPNYVFGVVNIRGKIVTVIDLKGILSLDYVGFNDFASIVVIEHNDELVGIVADEVLGINNIDVETIQHSKPKVIKIKDSFLKGITNETLIILNIEKVLSENSILVDETVN
ncbi:MAG: hypothetical protein C0595_12010 [Marinilabiliales bacterium]|nr:MAG: hypothetical protein C0595_12010 [Marinilabiliales bacterium]